MKVSTLIRVHGKQPYLLEAISSVLRQEASFSHDLWLILDRPSVETRSCIENLSDSKVKIFKPIGKGFSEPLTELLAELDSEYVAILDADDVMLPQRLQIQADFLDLNENVAVVGSNIMIISGDGSEIGRKVFDTRSDELFRNRYRNLPIAHPAAMYRRAVIVKVGSYRRFYDYAEDYDLWLRVMEESLIVNLNQFLTQYRVHGEQTNSMHIKSNVLAGVLAKKSSKRREKGKLDLSDIHVSPEKIFYSPIIFIEVIWRTLERVLWKKVFRPQSLFDFAKILPSIALLVLISPRSVIRKFISHK